MTSNQLREARRKLGLNLAQMAWALGYETQHGKSQVKHMETGKTIMPAQRRLIEAYLAGYRPRDWGRQHRDGVPPGMAQAKSPREHG
jgi:hypothetical protein